MLQHSMTQTAVATLGLHVCSHTQSHHHTHSSPPPPHTYTHTSTHTHPHHQPQTCIQNYRYTHKYRHTGIHRQTDGHTNIQTEHTPIHPTSHRNAYRHTQKQHRYAQPQTDRWAGSQAHPASTGRQAGRQASSIRHTLVPCWRAHFHSCGGMSARAEAPGAGTQRRGA